jgi:hypothetical protein
MNIPIVVPDWIKGCEAEGRILGVRQYYLDADPRLRSVGPSVVTTHTPERPRTPPMTPSTKVTPPTPEQTQGPVVPPKDLPMRNSSGGSSTIREEVAAETAPEGKRVSADSVSSEEEEEDDDVSSEEEASIAKDPRVSSDEEEIAAGKGKQAKAESVREDEPSFQDVAL